MALRREEPGDRTVTDAGEARALAAEIKDRAARLRVTPGLLDGSLEEVRSTLDRILREYEKLSRRRFGSFERDLNVLAKRVQELEDAGRLAPKQIRLVTQALQHARRVHFWNARRVIGKIDKLLGPTREWRQDIDRYRSFHRKAAQRVRDAEDALAALRAIPKPPEGPDAVARLRALVEACSRAADDAWAVQTHRPLVDALEDLVAHPDVDGLGLLSTKEFACLRELSDLLEAREALNGLFGPRPLAEVVLTSEYSAAKWDRVFPDATEHRRRLQDLFHHLRPVVTGTHGAAFSADVPATELQRRVAAWRRFPGAGGARAWDGMANVLKAGRIAQIQESAHLYERHGDLARRAWDGRLADEVAAQEKELVAARKAVAALASPDSLGG